MLMIRPKRRFSMPFSAARDRRKAAVRLIARTVSQSASFMRMKRASRVTPALLTRMSIGPSALSTAGNKRLGRRGVREIARRHMGPNLELGGERFERLPPRAGERDRGALRVQGARDRLAKSARSAGDERSPSCQIEQRRRPSRRILRASPRR